MYTECCKLDEGNKSILFYSTIYLDVVYERLYPVKSLSNAVPWVSEYWIIYRGLGFLDVVWFGSSPIPSYSVPSESSTCSTKEDLDRETTRSRKSCEELAIKARSSIDHSIFSALGTFLHYFTYFLLIPASTYYLFFYRQYITHSPPQI